MPLLLAQIVAVTLSAAILLVPSHTSSHTTARNYPSSRVAVVLYAPA